MASYYQALLLRRLLFAAVVSAGRLQEAAVSI
jgi:hypothetical protein